jgi:hypothetical protein
MKSRKNKRFSCFAGNAQTGLTVTGLIKCKSMTLLHPPLASVNFCHKYRHGAAGGIWFYRDKAKRFR